MDGLLHDHRAARENHDRIKDQLETTRQSESDLRDAVKVAQEVAATVQAEAHRRIADVVTRSLRAVFEDDAYEFKIRFEQKRGKTEAVLLFERNGVEVDPTEASGGGVVDIASLALRLSCLMLVRPPLRRFLCLDEPLKHLDRDRRPKAAALIRKLSEELDVQFLIITHDAEMEIGKVIQL